MNNLNLEQSIKALKNQPLPEPGAEVRRQVWRRIEAYRESDSKSPIFGLGSWKLEWVFGAFAFGVLFSFGIALLTASQVNQSLQKRELAVKALDFSSFRSEGFVGISNRAHR